MKQLKACWDEQKTKLTSRLDSLRAEYEAVMKLNEAAKTELQAGVDSYKLGFDKEMERVAEMQLQRDRVENELSTLKFSLQRAENNQMLARQELAHAKVPASGGHKLLTRLGSPSLDLISSWFYIFLMFLIALVLVLVGLGYAYKFKMN
ncbi:hypothetical protein R1sor_023750 [Riccia sorocarpa]|uniref:Uncharacterized protein n=1 Tax=Riccia sorocarpa TaxID=122646 RepID=A0ABD3GUG5_9MARC